MTVTEAEQELWTRFKDQGDTEARNRLVVHYSPLVKYVAGRVRSGLPASVDQDDVISDGVIGLMDALEKFDPGRGLQFQTYAVTRIRGAMVDALRSGDWVPRTVRDRVKQHDAATQELTRTLGRTPTERELAEKLELTVEAVRRQRSDSAHTRMASLDESVEGDDDHLAGQLELRVADDDLPAGFIKAIRALPERDQIVLALYYWERFTLAEIGRVLGVSESRISQLMSRATKSLRVGLAEARDH